MKRVQSLDVLGEVRRALRILRRCESYMKGQEARERRAQLARQQREQDERDLALSHAKEIKP